MPPFRFLLFASKNASRDTFNLFSKCGSLRNIQCRGFTKTSKHSFLRTPDHPVMGVDDRISQRFRSWTTILIPASGLLGFIGVVFFIHRNDEKRAVLKGEGNSSVSRTRTGPIIGGPFTLIDTENRLITEQNLQGNWVLLYFGYTSSPDVGPEQLKILTKAIDILESTHNVTILPVFVTIDPQRDSPAQLGVYLKEFSSRIVGLTGPSNSVRQIAQEYRVYYKKVEDEGDDYLVESSHSIYLLNPKLEVMRWFGVEYGAEELASAVVDELNNATNSEL